MYDVCEDLKFEFQFPQVESASQSALSEKGSSHQIPAKDTGTG